MVLPLLFSFGLPALAKTAAFGGALAGLSAPMLAGFGAGLGSFLQSGDIGKGVQTGLTAVLGGKLLGGLGGALGGPQAAASANALASGTATTPAGFLQPVLGENLATTIATPGVLDTALIGASTAAGLNRETPKRKRVDVPDPRPKIRVQNKKPDNYKGEFNYFNYYDPEDYFNPPITTQRMSMGGQLHPVFNQLGAGIANSLNAQQNEKIRPFLEKVQSDATAEFGAEAFDNTQGSMFGLGRLSVGMPMNRLRPNIPSIPSDQPNFSQYMRGGGRGQGLRGIAGARNVLTSMAEGGEVEVDDMREDQLILNSIRAVKGELSIESSREVLGEFLEKYGKEALEDLVEKTKSGEYDDTVARFARGEKGMVRGPGDGSGEDDKVPATLNGTDPVLLTEDEFVIRKPTQEALTKAFGGGFLDKVNQAEEDAPKVLKKMVG